MSTRVTIHGASGRLGTLIAQEAGADFVGPVPSDGALDDCDVVIDVTSADGLDQLLGRLSGQPLLVGTTGALPLTALERYAAQAPVAVVPNFSVGIPMLLDLVNHVMEALPDDWQVEIVETHHAMKKDAPSGTAKRIARAIAAAGGPEDVATESLRLGDTVGEHTIRLTGPGERIELTHVATRREVFAIGALRWAAWLRDQPPGLYRP